MRTTNQAGSHVIGLAVAVLVVGIVGFTGYKVWDNSQPKSTDESSQEVPKAPEINETSDLTEASDTVDQLDTSITTDDLSSLEQELGSLE